MMKTFGIVLATLVLTANFGTALAAVPETEEAPQQEKKICKNEKVTGSLTRVRRVCLTQREWDRMAETTRRGVNELDRNASRGGSAGTD